MKQQGMSPLNGMLDYRPYRRVSMKVVVLYICKISQKVLLGGKYWSGEMSVLGKSTYSNVELNYEIPLFFIMVTTLLPALG